MDNQDYEMKKDIDQSRENTTRTKHKKKTSKKLILQILIIVVIAAGILLIPRLFGGKENKEEILTISTLEKIINISELSTFQAVYNGITEVKNEKKPNQLDYYVSYEARVNAGFDFKKIKITMDEEVKKITVTIPQIEIIDVNVDITSLDYMFQNKKANKSTVSAQAYKACKEDAKYESEKESAIYELAEQNAKNIMKALLSPFIEQIDSEYELEIIKGDV